MDPNNTNPSNTPPVGDTPPAQPPAPEAPVPTGEPISPVGPAPITPSGPQSTPLASTPFVAQPAPVQPEAPGAPQSPKQSTQKKLFIVLAIVGGAILLAAIGIIIFLSMNTVSKKDYQAAATQYNKVSSSSASLSSDVSTLSYSTSGTSDTTFDSNVSEVQTSLKNLSTENEALAELKAVRVGEGAKLYKAFDDKVTAYIAYADGLVTSVKNLRPALVICRKATSSSDSAARIAAMKECSTSLEAVTDIPNAEMKTYVAALTTSYKEYAALYEQVTALKDPYGSQYEQYKALRDKVYAIQDSITAAGKTFTAALKKKDEEVSVKESAAALRAYLIEQQS